VLHDETHGAGFDVGKSVDRRRDASLLLRPVDSKRLVQRTITFQFTASNTLQSGGKCDAVASEVSAFCLYIILAPASQSFEKYGIIFVYSSSWMLFDGPGLSSMQGGNWNLRTLW
jgi:hypothetical protein